MVDDLGFDHVLQLRFDHAGSLWLAGGAIQTSVNGMTPDTLGYCDLFEERQIGAERYKDCLFVCSLFMKNGQGSAI
jgi:hypothetical protein